LPFDQKTLSVVATAEVPTTTKDRREIAMWKHGDKVYGTEAKDDEFFKEYRKDINKAWGRQDDYEENMIFINTLSEKEKVSEQYNKVKK
jgi:glutamate synthase domain-containing protein 1